MLESALKVVEAARALGLMEENGITKSPLDRHTLARNLSKLRAAIETFDYETAASFSTPDMAPRPGFATPPQLDDEGVDELDINLTPDFQPGIDAALRRDVVKDTDPSLENSVTQVSTATKSLEKLPEAIVVPGMRRPSLPGRAADYSDIDDTLLFDNDESVGDFMLAIDRIEDKMGYAVMKNGWSPRLKNLAHAVMEMRKRLILEVRQDGILVTIPAHVFSGLTSTIADAVLDADMKMLVPQLTASLNNLKAKEPDYTHAPRPKFLD
jgi:hypothetical protein